MTKNKLPKITILATGGTIAGQAPSSSQLTGYEAGAVGVEALISAVPQLTEIADISGEQIANIDSKDMDAAIWLRLAQRCDELLAGDADGVVITHGTDTMEETAYFLNLTVHSNKPVVLVGAMRPATAISADGPLNLLNAVLTASSSEAYGKGVLVVMNDEIYSARNVVKMSTTNVAAFKAPLTGALGEAAAGRVVFYKAPLRRHTTDSQFDVSSLAACDLPRVDIVYSYAGADDVFIRAAIAAGARGIIYAGCGMGSIPERVEKALGYAVAQGIVVVRSSRVASGVVADGLARWSAAGFLHSDTLNPQKARVLLQLALTRTSDRAAIQKIFDEY